MESLFNIVTGLKCFLINFEKYLKNTYFKNYIRSDSITYLYHRNKPLIFSVNQQTGLHMMKTCVTEKLIFINLVLRNKNIKWNCIEQSYA